MQPRTAALALGGVAAFFYAAVLSDPVRSSTCEITDTMVARILKLPFREFDQNPDDGWRPYYASKCYKEAAQLLTDYMFLHPERAKEHHMLAFHAGQMFAMIGEYDWAVDLMRQGYLHRSSAIIDWNAFVDANIAFLENDHETLVRMRERIAKQPVMTEAMGTPDWAIGKKMNLDVVDGFIACFDKAYSVAYEDECRAKGGE
jgi:hypothetical protein